MSNPETQTPVNPNQAPLTPMPDEILVPPVPDFGEHVVPLPYEDQVAQNQTRAERRQERRDDRKALNEHIGLTALIRMVDMTTTVRDEKGKPKLVYEESGVTDSQGELPSPKTLRERHRAVKTDKKVEAYRKAETERHWRGKIGNSIASDQFGKRAKLKGWQLKRAAKADFKAGKISAEELKIRKLQIDANRPGVETSVQRSTRRKENRTRKSAIRYIEKSMPDAGQLYRSFMVDETGVDPTSGNTRGAVIAETEQMRAPSPQVPVAAHEGTAIPENTNADNTQLFTPERVEGFRRLVRNEIYRRMQFAREIAEEQGIDFDQNEADIRQAIEREVYTKARQGFFDKTDALSVLEEVSYQDRDRFDNEIMQLHTREPEQPTPAPEEAAAEPVRQPVNADFYLNDDAIKHLDSAIAEAIRNEAHRRKDERGVSELPREEFSELVKSVRAELLGDYFDTEDDEEPVSDAIKREVERRLAALRPTKPGGQRPPRTSGGDSSQPRRQQGRPRPSTPSVSSYEDLQKLFPNA